MDPKREIEALRAEIMEHNRHYYDEDAPVISDFEYDALMRRLEELEAAQSPVMRTVFAWLFPFGPGWNSGALCPC